MRSEETKGIRHKCRRPVSEEQGMSQRVVLQMLCVRDGVEVVAQGTSWTADFNRLSISDPHHDVRVSLS